MTAHIKEMIFQGNQAWSLMYYDEFIVNEGHHLTYIEDADRPYYNCAHVYDRISDNELLSLETFFAERQSPSRVYTHAFTDESFISLLQNRGYRYLPEEDEVWYEYALAELPIVPEFKTALAIESIDPRSSKLDEFMHLNQTQNEMSAELVSKCLAKIRNHPAAADNEYYNAYMDNNLATIGTLACFGERAFLAEGATHSLYQKRGFYSQLVAHRLHLSKARGCKYAYVRCDKEAFSNNACVKLGFKKVLIRHLWELI